MPAQVIRTTVPLVLNQDHLDLRRVILEGKLVEFSVNYRIRLGEWHEVVRYDNCHDGPHMHRFWLTKARQVTQLSVATGSVADFQGVFDYAREDLKKNLVAYRAAMVGKLSQQYKSP